MAMYMKDKDGNVQQVGFVQTQMVNKAEWKLLAETEITQEMIDEAGEEGITAIVLDLGEPIEKWYGETWLRFECKSTKDLNEKEKIHLVFKFGKTETAPLIQDTSATCNVFGGHNTYGYFQRDYTNGINIFTNWYDGLPYGTIMQYLAYNSGPYATVTASAVGFPAYITRITAMRYAGFYGTEKKFKFPAGAKLKLYGRFEE